MSGNRTENTSTNDRTDSQVGSKTAAVTDYPVSVFFSVSGRRLIFHRAEKKKERKNENTTNGETFIHVGLSLNLT